jgi:RNA polymerase sigma factor (sigma-70 family)
MRSESVVREFQRLLEPGTVAGLTERQVLERFAERGDPVAFEAIVTRHGPMVYTVCRQMLRDPNDVDDAFQATFLILIKKAGRLRQPERLGPWLYGVAYRVAHRLRTRPPTSNLPENLAGPRLACPVEDNESVEALHDEIQRLPEEYRVPIVLCGIEGLSHVDAASRLGWPVGTVHGRLSRARERLRNQLSRRGVVVSEAIPEALALIRPGQVVLPEATRLAASALVRGTMPASIEILTKGVLTAMIFEKLRQTGICAVIVLMGLGTVTTALLAYQAPATLPDVAKAKSSAPDGEPAKSHETKNVSPLKTISEDRTRRENEERLRVENQIESSHVAVDELLADAALIEIELDITTKRIEKTIEFLENRESQFVEHSRLTPQETTEAIERLEIRRQRMHDQLRRDRKVYAYTWSNLARIKREIARESRRLGVATEPSSSGTELGRRLDVLEKKIDRIIDSLPAKYYP